jgi:hypothetical protein
VQSSNPDTPKTEPSIKTKAPVKPKGQVPSKNDDQEVISSPTASSNSSAPPSREGRQESFDVDEKYETLSKKTAERRNGGKAGKQAALKSLLDSGPTGETIATAPISSALY